MIFVAKSHTRENSLNTCCHSTPVRNRSVDQPTPADVTETYAGGGDSGLVCRIDSNRFKFGLAFVILRNCDLCMQLSQRKSRWFNNDILLGKECKVSVT
jgi:hypothetical protein